MLKLWQKVCLTFVLCWEQLARSHLRKPLPTRLEASTRQPVSVIACLSALLCLSTTGVKPPAVESGFHRLAGALGSEAGPWLGFRAGRERLLQCEGEKGTGAAGELVSKEGKFAV